MAARALVSMATIAAIGGFVVAAQAAEVADAVRGERLSQRWCAGCHMVTADQAKASPDAPSFAALANDPGRTAEGIADFLTLPGTTHSRMPDLQLSRVEILDIAAHIATLKK